MFKSYNIYPKNKITGTASFLQFPLRHSNTFSAGKSLKFEYKPVFTKSKKIRKLIEELNSSNKSYLINNNYNKNYDEHNNLYICQKLLLEERMKNKNYTDNIIKLNNHIDELEYQLSQKCEHQIMNDEFIRLRKENEELKLFKQKVYEYSTKYDEINNDILNCLKNIEKIVDSYQSINQNTNYKEDKNNILDKISDNFNSIVKNLTNYLKTKQNEYNSLLMEKENEINKLKQEFNNKSNINKYSESAKYTNNIEIDVDNRNKDNDDNNKDYFQTNGNYEPYSVNKINLGNENEEYIRNNTFQNV